MWGEIPLTDNMPNSQQDYEPALGVTDKIFLCIAILIKTEEKAYGQPNAGILVSLLLLSPWNHASSAHRLHNLKDLSSLEKARSPFLPSLSHCATKIQFFSKVEGGYLPLKITGQFSVFCPYTPSCTGGIINAAWVWSAAAAPVLPILGTTLLSVAAGTILECCYGGSKKKKEG